VSKLGISSSDSRGLEGGGRPGDFARRNQATAQLSLTFCTPGQCMYDVSLHVYASFLSTLHLK